MKLLDDEKIREENFIKDGIERNKLGLENTSCDDGHAIKMTTADAKEDRKNAVTQTWKLCPDDSMSNKKVKDQIRIDDSEVNKNMNKEGQHKAMRQLTEEVAKLRLDYKKDVNTGRKDIDVRSGERKPSDKPVSVDGGDSDNAYSKGTIDDITARVKEISLESKFNNGAKQADDNIVVIAKKVEFVGRESSGVKIEECRKTSESEGKSGAVVVAQSEKQGEENEDCDNTCLLSDANCMSFVGRGPFNGVPRYNGIDDSDDYAQPRKYSRPFVGHVGSNMHMSGGSVQIVPPNIQPTVFDQDNFEGLNNVHRMHHPYEKANRPCFMPPMSEMNLMCGPPFDFNSSFNPLDWAMNPQHSTYGGLGNERPYLGDIVRGYDEFPLSQHAIDAELGGFGFPEPPSPLNSSCSDPQLPARSPHDQVLSSPGSSPSYANSPYSTASPFAKDCDTAVMSPSSCSMSSPDSGILTDLPDETTLDLLLALEYVQEHASDECAAERTPPLPELIEALNTGLDPIGGGTVLPFSSGSCTAGSRTDKPKDAKKSTPKTRRSKQTARILPPVSGGDYVPSGAVFPPHGINFNMLNTNFQMPCVLAESSAKINRQPVSTRPRTIQPKPTTESSASSVAMSQTSQSGLQLSALPIFSPPSNSPSPSQESTVSSTEQDQLVKAYRWVAGLPKEKLLVQDDDGDTILHLTIVKEERKLVKALLERYVREGLIDKVINLANKQHQTPLCLAVFLNQTDIVKMLIERGADVNVQLQRKLNGGLMCYRLIHYAAKRGQKWVPTLTQLLSAQNLDLHAFDSDGCTAMHCAIRDHGETRQGSEKINSKDTIYKLALRGADLNYQHGLSGKTPLHYAIEKKDSDLVGWFLGLTAYIQSSGTNVSGTGNAAESLMHGVLNTKPSGGISALQLALNIQMDQEERVKILEFLLNFGAEVSQKSCDGKLRQELGKYPTLAPLLKNGTNVPKNVR